MSYIRMYMPEVAWRPEGSAGYGRSVFVHTFPDGETAVSLPAGSVFGNHVTLVGDSASAERSESFLAAAYELASKGPASLTVINTYFRHARSERPSGDNITMAKFQARQWSGLGRMFPGVRLVFLDLHSDLILNYFEGPVVTKHLSARPALKKQILEELPPNAEVVYATVDEGGVFAAKELANKDHVGFAYIEKKRLSGSETAVVKVLGDSVAGKTVIIFDDIIATGGSAIKAAQAYTMLGATSVILGATHGVFAGDALEKLLASDIQAVYVTASHPAAVQAAKDYPSFVKQVYLEI